jgi:predicted acyltransferase
MSLATPPAKDRITSMDQFRGYTVAGMCLVNFLGNYAAIHPVLKHNNNYFSYADSIMPSFMFACGFSYRLSALRRLAQVGPGATYRRFVGRSLGLVLVSVMMYGFGTKFRAWSEVTPESVGHFLVRLVKADLWETLAIIGVGQLLIMGVIAAGAAARLGTIGAFVAAHLALSYVFNFDFVSGLPNPLDAALGTEGSTAWDGGVFGLLMWSSMMLAGSLAYDARVALPAPRASARLVRWGVALMAVAYGLSCLSMLYDGEPALAGIAGLREKTGGPEKPSARDRREVAESPVWPPLERISGRPVSSLLAEPPFVQPPPPSHRPYNYWMMTKRVVSLPFLLCSVGFASALYGLFVWACDPSGRGLGVFRTFGTNPLAAYVLHHMVEVQVQTLVPGDAPLWACLAGLSAFAAITYLFVRFLEKQGVYVRL